MTDIKLENLKKEIPHQWRVQSYSKNKAVATCIAYIDGRDAQDLLDEVCGPENWQDTYKQIGDALVCGIGIYLNGQWVWKWDTGSNSKISSDIGLKDLYSDAFKRAAVKWGVGRFLYRKDIIFIDTNGPKNDRNKYPHVVDKSGNKVYNLTKHINSLQGVSNGRKQPAKQQVFTLSEHYKQEVEAMLSQDWIPGNAYSELKELALSCKYDKEADQVMQQIKTECAAYKKQYEQDYAEITDQQTVELLQLAQELLSSDKYEEINADLHNYTQRKVKVAIAKLKKMKAESKKKVAQ